MRGRRCTDTAEEHPKTPDTQAMDPIQDALKQLQENLKKSDAALAAADGALASSQIALNQARVTRNDVTQRLTPLQRLASGLEASHAALEKERTSALSDVGEAEKFYGEVFPLVEKGVDPKKRAILEKAEAEALYLETANATLRQKLEDAKAAQKAAQDKAGAADFSLRDFSSKLGGLEKQIQAARKQLSTLLAAARNAFALGQTGQTFLQLRDVHAQAANLSKLADPKTEENLHQAIEQAWQDGKAAKAEVAAKTDEVTKLTKDVADGEANLQLKRSAVADARAALAAAKVEGTLTSANPEVPKTSATGIPKPVV